MRSHCLGMLLRRIRTCRPAFFALFSLTAFLLSAQAAFAGSVYLNGEKLPHDYLSGDDHYFVALDDVQGPLGLSVVCDARNLLIGGAVRGTMTVELRSHVAKVGQQQIDFDTKMLQNRGLWYVPDTFLQMALGVKARMKLGSTDLTLYPEVVAIIPTDSAIVIVSSLQPDFTTFELSAPARRIVDIKGAFLLGANLNVPGSSLGTANVAALRASQFSVEPPIVRVVVEWTTDLPPTHTLFPEEKTLAVLIGSSATNSVPSDALNLLASGSGPDEEIAPAGNVTDTPPVQETTDPIEAADPVAAPDPVAPSADPNLGPVVPSPDAPVQPPGVPLPSVPQLPDSAENVPLDQLGWKVDFLTEGEDQIAALQTSPFTEVNVFTLKADGAMRLVLDLKDAYIPGKIHQVEGQGDIARVRIAQFQPDVTRVVFDLSRVVGWDIDQDPIAGRITVRLLSGGLGGRTIVIDPGHGGEDPGAVVAGVEEKHLNLQMALALKGFLEQHGARVFLTRETDVYVTLADRVNTAIQHHADLMICVHNNATETATGLQGALILYKNMQWLPLYRLAYRAIAAHTGVPGIGPIKDQRGLYILRNCDIPVLFVEAAFMTNSIDFARLTDSSGAYSRNIMQGVTEGVLAYYEGRDLPPVTLPASCRDLNGGIFDLTGRPLVPGAETVTVDSGSAWDIPETASDEEGSGETASGGDESGSGEETAGDTGGSDSSGNQSDDEYSRNRGRGAYRFHR